MLDTTGAARSFEEVSPSQLEQLVTLTQEAMESSLRSGELEALNTLVRGVHDLLNAESCSLFHILPDRSDTVKLVAEYCDKLGPTIATPVVLPIVSETGKGLTGHLVSMGAPANWGSEELENNQYYAHAASPHLAGPCLSLLAIPIKDDKDQVIGLLKVENKKGANGKVTAQSRFSRSDETLAHQIARSVSLCVERYEHKVAYEMGQRATSEPLDYALNLILQAGIWLVRADYGDVVTEDVSQRLILAQSLGGSSLLPGSELPQRSFVRDIWNSQTGHAIIKNYEEHKGPLHPTRSDGRSAIAILIQLGENQVGALHFESRHAGAFDEADRVCLQDLAKQAQIVLSSLHTRRMNEQLLSMLQSADQIARRDEFLLEHVLEYACGHSKDYAAALFKPNLSSQKLWLAAHIGCPEAAPEAAVALTEQSLINTAWKEKSPAFSLDPPNDPRVHQGMIRYFGVGPHPLLAYPLEFQGRVLAVLAVWSKSAKAPNKKAAEGWLRRLQARLGEVNAVAAGSIWALEAVRGVRQAQILHIRELVYMVQASMRLGTDDFQGSHSVSVPWIDSMERALRTSGFERITLYRFHESRKQLVRWFRPDAGAPPRASLEQALRSIQETSIPEAQRGVHDGTPFCWIPLLFDAKLYGTLEADTGDAPQRDITPDAVSYMTLVGTLAAHAVGFRDWMRRRIESMVDNLGRPAKTLKSAVGSAIEEFGSALAPDERVLLSLIEGMTENIDWQLLQLNEWLRLHDWAPKPALIELSEVVQSCVAEIENRWSRKDVHFLVECPSVSWSGDRKAITLILSNLLDNAARYSANTERPRIAVQCDGASLSITVLDDGPGILTDQEDLIVREFKTIPRSNKQSSSGLGLSFVRHLVNRLGGEFECAADSSGVYRVFRVTLPDPQSLQPGPPMPGGLSTRRAIS